MSNCLFEALILIILYYTLINKEGDYINKIVVLTVAGQTDHIFPKALFTICIVPNQSNREKYLTVHIEQAKSMPRIISPWQYNIRFDF